jgi:NADPH:quinone reductase-like Zn-dependent oxidoreductase
VKRVVVRRPGGFDRLELIEQADPVAGQGEVLVETAAIGVNFADCVVRMGLYPAATEYVGWPITPGFEFSGTVLSSGSQRFEPGARVFGVMRFGAYASRVVVSEDQLVPVPNNLTMEQAGSAFVPCLTAWFALSLQGGAKPGHRVLVHSAAGGVGSTAVQMAVALGCHVVAVVGSREKVGFVEALGAAAVIDRSAGGFEERARALEPRGYDIVLDANGYETLRSSYALLGPMGRLVVYGAHTMLTRGSGRRNWLRLAFTYLRTPRFDPLALTNDNKSVMAFNLSYLFEKKEALLPAVPQIVSWLEQGKIAFPRVDGFPLSRVADAHRTLQSGRTVGRLVLVPDSQ